MIRAVLIFLLSLCPAALAAQEFRALARVLAEGTGVEDAGHGVALSLSLSQSVPYRVAVLGAPNRLVLDFREVAWESLPEGFDAADGVVGVSTGAARGETGWSRMVLELAVPMDVESAEMRTDAQTGTAVVLVRLVPGEPVAAIAPAPLVSPDAVALDGRFIVALDPGHGGVDPGAEAGGLQEAQVMLGFARELAERLVRTGEAEVVLTRQADRFVSLPERISIARAAGADVLLSLHADALAEGRASGATIYTLSDEASAQADGLLAERFGRSDLIAGVDLSSADDQVAGLLMELALQDTAPRSDTLAAGILAALESADIPLHRQPRLEAGFTVLTAADIPSVLLEIGYLSDAGDRGRIEDAGWRASLQEALVAALLEWHRSESFRADLLRR